MNCPGRVRQSSDNHFSSAWLVLVAICILGLTGCKHKEFDYEPLKKRVPVKVEFDWSNDAAASPQIMTVYFYRINDKNKASSAYVFDFNGKEGGTVSLPEGNYAALCFNDDASCYSIVGHTAHHTFGLRLNDIRNASHIYSPSATDIPEERLAYSPEPLWVASLPLITIQAPPASAQVATQVVRFTMLSVVHRYTFIIHNPINLSSSHSIIATISGMASTVHPGQEMTGSETVKHVFRMNATAKGELTGSMLTFGHCGAKPLNTRGEDNAHTAHILTVSATLPDNTKWNYTCDVTNLIHNSSSADCVVELDTVVLPPPTPTTNGNGFQPDVGGWQGTQETLHI